MKLRFRVNQAECLKRGIDAPKSIVTIEVTPSELPVETRTMLALHMQGIDVCEIDKDGNKLYLRGKTDSYGNELEPFKDLKASLIEADEPTLEGLLEAIQENEKNVHRSPKTKGATI
ncbi:MAG TPA: hypothetical protein VN836_05715 [Verrucomicrobiae bacterium]|nr:hypothetical protein [Verrucomicrobiae bacterium]